MIRAYHFVGDKLRDGKDIPPDGEWLEHDGDCIICQSGLHASQHPFDALQYAPGATLCLVECEDVVVEHDDKFVCRRRRIVARFDATELLWQMARWSALQVIHLWDAPKVVRDYLTTGNESLRSAAGAAAADAAWDTARAAARSAAAAARAAAGARDAARAAAAAARAAAGAAARDAARAAAWAAARDAQAWAAAGAAARDAARAAAKDAQETKFKEMVDAKFAELGVA